MASSDPYQQIQFWNKPRKKTFCEEVHEEFLRRLQQDIETALYPNNDKTIRRTEREGNTD